MTDAEILQAAGAILDRVVSNNREIGNEHDRVTLQYAAAAKVCHDHAVLAEKGAQARQRLDAAASTDLEFMGLRLYRINPPREKA